MVDSFLRDYASRARWNPASRDRLASAGEETLAILMQDIDEAEPLHLTVTASTNGNSVDIEFVTSLPGENVEDYLAHLAACRPPPANASSPTGCFFTTLLQSATRSITM